MAKISLFTKLSFDKFISKFFIILRSLFNAYLFTSAWLATVVISHTLGRTQKGTVACKLGQHASRI